MNFSTFISGFEKKMLEAGRIDWNDQVTKTFFNNALNTEMHKALIGFPIPPTYTGYCNMFHGMNNQFELLRFKDKRDGLTTIIKITKNAGNSTAVDSTTTTNDEMNWRRWVRHVYL